MGEVGKSRRIKLWFLSVTPSPPPASAVAAVRIGVFADKSDHSWQTLMDHHTLLPLAQTNYAWRTKLQPACGLTSSWLFPLPSPASSSSFSSPAPSRDAPIHFFYRYQHLRFSIGRYRADINTETGH